MQSVRLQLMVVVSMMMGVAYAPYASGQALPSLPPSASANSLPPTAPSGVAGLPALELPKAVPGQAAPTLPASNLPQMPVVAPGVAVATEAKGAVEEPKKFSYGSSDITILFMPDKMQKMREAIRTFENSNINKPVPVEAPQPVVETTGPAPVIPEPTEYPVFYLSSIAYDAPDDWSIWVSGHKITSRVNDTDVKVVSVTRESVTFSWQPSYVQAITTRRLNKQFGKTDAVANKLAATQMVTQDDTTTIVTFTLRQNQSFAVGYFSVFEGYMDNPKLPVLVATQNALPTEGNGFGTPAGIPTTDPNMPASIPTNTGVNPSGMPSP